MKTEPTDYDKNDVFVFLDELRESGETNMYGARPYIQAEFGCGAEQAKEYLLEWMRTFSERHPQPAPDRAGKE